MDSDGRPIVNSANNIYDGHVNDASATNLYEGEVANHYASNTLGRTLKYRDESQHAPEENGFAAHIPTSISTTFSPIPLSELATHIDRLKLNNNALFIQEYESIETGHSFT